ncbi:MAG: hypothetical protein M3342_20070 [Bacteroidota bacterium]|nr:hypothetical protein [Bacteroidota bacterium]
MENGNFIEKLAAQFSQNASVKNVFGGPIQAGEKTIIPVAQIAYGLGGGYGQGKGKKVSKSGEAPLNDDGANGEGAGGGGGMYAKPKGVYEITATSTRFIPANSTRLLLLGLGIGFLLRGWFLRHRR